MIKPVSDWRAIETALISLLREYEFEITYERGDSFIVVNDDSICLADFARELEERL